MPPLSYLEFVVAFVATPALALAALGVGIDRERRPAAAAGVAVMLALALSYTTPWDNYLIARGVWWYAADSVAFRVWNAPVEEYAFIALQTVLAALWLYRRPVPLPDPTAADDVGSGRAVTDGAGAAAETTDAKTAGRSTAAGVDGETSSRFADGESGEGAGESPPVGVAPSRLRRRLPAILGGGAWLAVAGLGVLALSGPTFYLGAILAWAGPVLALQWVVGGRYLLAVRRHLLVGVLPPTVYLCLVDRLAIGWGIWTIAPDTSTGLTVAGLPVEEATFFLLTNLLVVQGLLLFHWMVETRPWRPLPGSDRGEVGGP